MEAMTQDDNSWSSVSSGGSGGVTEEGSLKKVEEEDEVIVDRVAINIDSHENPKTKQNDDGTLEQQSVEELKNEKPQTKQSDDTTSEQQSVEELKKELAKKDELLTSYKKQVEELTVESSKSNELVVSLENKLNDVESKLKIAETDQDMAVKLLRGTLLTEMLLENIDTCTGQDVINTIDSLTLGSNKFEVTELKAKAVKFAREVLNRKPTLAVAVLAALDSSAVEEGSDVEEVALATIRSNPDMLLQYCKLLGFERMESIMADKGIEADEYFMFCILFAWSNTTGQDDGLATACRKLVASGLTKHIALENIDPTLLGTEVWKSGLVSDKQIIEAFVKQAPQAKKNMAFKERHRPRPLPKGAWESSGNQLLEHYCFADTIKTDKVVGHVMNTTGVYKWSFRVINAGFSSYAIFGVALASQQISRSDYLGKTSSTWGFSTKKGFPIHNGVFDESNPALFSETLTPDTTIKIVLTLSHDGLSNRLEAAVGSKEMVELFWGGDLVGDGNGFVPASSLYGNASVEFLGFER